MLKFKDDEPVFKNDALYPDLKLVNFRLGVVIAHLSNLDVDEFVDALEFMGIRGERGECDTCPVAELIKRLIPGNGVKIASINVQRESFGVGITVNDYPAYGEYTFKTPVWEEFIRQFDMGYLPELDTIE